MASFFINLLTLTAEIGGIALALHLASSVETRLWIPVAALAVWLVLWRVKFSVMENVAGLMGLLLIGLPAGSGLGRPGARQVTRPSLPEASTRPPTGSTRWPSSVPR